MHMDIADRNLIPGKVLSHDIHEDVIPSPFIDNATIVGLELLEAQKPEVVIKRDFIKLMGIKEGDSLLPSLGPHPFWAFRNFTPIIKPELHFTSPRWGPHAPQGMHNT